MTLRKIILSCFILYCLGIGTSLLIAKSYEASTLHNSVSRSETVQELYYKRWETIAEKNLSLDTFGRINWIPNFSINTINAGNNELINVPMTLVRTYGSVTVQGNLFDEEKDALGFDVPYTGPTLAFTATGFHYGLTRDVEMKRGTADDFSGTDYKYTQFFDDVFAVTFRYIPYVTLHGGVVINNEIEPKENGTMEYEFGDNIKKSYIYSIGLFDAVDSDALFSENKMEKIAFTLQTKTIIGFFHEMPQFLKAVDITFKRVKLYNDKKYDAVWVNRVKNLEAGDTREQANLDTVALFTRLEHNRFAVEGLVKYQRPSEDLVDKRTTEIIDVAPIKEWRFGLEYTFYYLEGLNKNKTLYMRMPMTLMVGYSHFWDPSISIHSEKGDTYYTRGFFATFDINAGMQYLQRPAPMPSLGRDPAYHGNNSMFIIGLSFSVYHNYSAEVEKLVESVDKTAIEFSMYMKF